MLRLKTQVRLVSSLVARLPVPMSAPLRILCELAVKLRLRSHQLRDRRRLEPIRVVPKTRLQLRPQPLFVAACELAWRDSVMILLEWS